VAKVLLELLRGIGSHAEGPDAQNLGVEEGLGIGLDVTDEALDEVLGLGTGRSDEDGVAPVDALKGCFLGSEFIGELLSPIFESVHATSLFSLDRLLRKPKCRFSSTRTQAAKRPEAIPREDRSTGLLIILFNAIRYRPI